MSEHVPGACPSGTVAFVPAASSPDGLDQRLQSTGGAHTAELLAALHTARDYVADAASGGLTYEGSGEGFIAMAKEDLARIEAAIAKAEGR